MCKQMTDVTLLPLHSSTWNHLTLCKQMSTGFFKNVINKIGFQIIDMNKQNLALNNLKWLICHQIQLNQTKPNQTFLK